MFQAGLQNFKIITNHNLLIPVPNNYWLEFKNPKLQCFHTRPMAINFTAKCCKKTTSHALDSLSHNPVAEPQIAEILVEQDEDSKPKMSKLQLRAISNELKDRQNMYGCRPFTNMQNKTTTTSLSRKSCWIYSWITKSTTRIMQIILTSLSSPYAERRRHYIFMDAPDNTNKDV